MANILKYGNEMVFHPGTYIEDFIEESGVTQAEYAKRLDTTPKNLSILVRGEQSLSVDMALKLERITNVSAETWLEIQKEFDLKKARFEAIENQKQEKDIWKNLDYMYFKKNYGIVDLKSSDDKNMDDVRRFLQVASLKILKLPDLSMDLQQEDNDLSEKEVVNSNAMLQIAINTTAKAETENYNKRKLIHVLSEYEMSKDIDLDALYASFLTCGVVVCKMPYSKDSSIVSASKKVGNKMMIMVHDRKNQDMLSQIVQQAHRIINGDMGISVAEK